MSMTSGQCDELREKAKLLRGHVDGLSAPYVIPSTKELMALTMLDSADRMERAADTILELRDDLQRANEATEDAEHDESMAWDRVRKAEAENTKLRELAAWMYRLMDESCAVQHPYAPEPIRYDTLMDAHEKLRELGIEADS